MNTHARARRIPAAATALALAGGVLAAAAPGAVTDSATAAQPVKRGIVLGVAGDVQHARRQTGHRLAAHHYGYFEDKKVEGGAMISVRFKDRRWASTAQIQRGSEAYRDVARWANTIEKRRGKVMIAFHHEPEQSGNTRFGNAAEYRAAFRKIVSIFRKEGARNAVFTWQMTSWAFRADPGTRQHARDWYPGNRYVDVVAADPYNWHECGHGHGRWSQLRKLVNPVLKFARARGKQVALAEFASDTDARRAAWLRKAGRYLAANDDTIAAAFYFHRMPTNSSNADCTWPLRTEAEWKALANMAGRKVFRP